MLQKLLDRFKKQSGKIKISCLGGAGEIGMNLYVYENAKAAIVVDCGVMFGDSSMPGIDAVFPDLSYLQSIQKKLVAVIFTHGHEDHIGGLLRLLELKKLPIYTGRFTAALLEQLDINIVNGEETHNIGGMEIDFIPVPHSIPDTFALRITTNGFTALHASDFRFDGYGEAVCERFAAKPVDCLLLDSTNATSDGVKPSGLEQGLREEDIKAELISIFREAKGRIFLTTFASNVQRLASAVEAAKAAGRKIVVEGAAMERTVGIACRQGLMDLPESMLMTTKKAYHADPTCVVYLVSGCQGEYTSTLYSIAVGERKAVQMLEGDLLIFSSRTIPGNEGSVNAMINAAMRRGVDVIQADDRVVHVSGHASASELATLIGRVKPAHFVPIHGEYQHLNRHMKLAQDAGVSESACIFMESGKQLLFEKKQLYKVEDISFGRVFVDYRGNFELNESELANRRRLARDGVVIIMLKPLSIRSYGFILTPDENSKLLKAINAELGGTNEEKLTASELATKAVKRYFRKFCDRRPIIDVID